MEFYFAGTGVLVKSTLAVSAVGDCCDGCFGHFNYINIKWEIELEVISI